MRTLLSCQLVIWAVTLVGVASAPAQVIFIDPCGARIDPQMSQSFNIWLCAENAAANGITAAEFRIAGLPSSWTASISPGQGTMTGDVFGDGVRVEFSSCEAPAGQYLHLFSVLITATDARNDVLLMVSATVPVSDPGLTCSFVSLCNSPNPTNICVGDHGAIINPAKLGCGLAVAERSWAEVKSLFR